MPKANSKTAARAGKASRGAGKAAAPSAATAGGPPAREFFSIGRYAGRSVAADGEAADSKHMSDFVMRERLMAVRAKSINKKAAGMTKVAGLFNDGQLGSANIADSDNIGYYSYEFPVDSLEMPQSRPEELRFYRLAYDRDPIVGRAIDLHTELPLSKMQLEKPKCSVEPFSDYVFDFFQRLMNDTQFFSTIIEATREYHTIGETFLYVIEPENFLELEVSDEVMKALTRGRGYSAGITPMTESSGGNIVGQEKQITEDWIQSKSKTSSLIHKMITASNPLAMDNWVQQRMKTSSLFVKAREEKVFEQLASAGMEFSEDEDLRDVKKAMRLARKKLATLIPKTSLSKIADDIAPPMDAPPEGDLGGGEPLTDAPLDDLGGGDMDGDLGGDPGMDGGVGAPGGFGGGGGGGGGMDATPEQADGASHALLEAADAERAQEINSLQRYLHLLERKKELLEELKDLTEKREEQREIFSHVTNPDYEGFDRVQMLAPEKIELSSDSSMGPEPMIMYKPTEEEKSALLENQDLDAESRETLESKGMLRLNTDPFKGPFVIHFARKKAGYELHGRSILQRCMRTIIYREKLRQVQTTLASRNMTPKTVITAPGISEPQVQELRAHADEMKADPDFTLVANYDMTWNEISSQGRLLTLGDEYQHLNSDIAIGLGFSPEILIGEGLYGGNRIQLEILNTTYTQYRENLTNVIENLIFKPIAMLKGFYEMDNYGRPRWIYPKVTFGRMALRDSGDLYEMMFNLYSKGSLPVSTILDFLGIDPETVKRQLEDDLFSVNDSKFNELLSNVYGAVSQKIVDNTDIVNRLAKGMTLKENDIESAPIEGSGEGM